MVFGLDGRWYIPGLGDGCLVSFVHCRNSETSE